jgi:hypothetical protein
MGGTSSLDLMTRRFESGMPRLVLQLAILYRGIPRVRPSPTLPMGGTSSLDLMTTRFESGMPRLVLQLANLYRGIPMGVSVAYSPDGRHIISGSYDKTIRIWDAETGAAVGKSSTGAYRVCVRRLLSRWAAHHLWI